MDPEKPLYEPAGDGFVATLRTQGGWNPHHQHGGPVQGLLTRAIENVSTLVPMQITRLTHDLFRPVPIGPTLTVDVEIIREGKRIQLLDAVLRVGDVEHARTRGLRLRTEDVSDLISGRTVPDGTNGPDAAYTLALPEELADTTMTGGAGKPGFLDGMELRAFPMPNGPEGSHGYWVRLLGPLIAGETTTPLQQMSVIADFTNMIGTTFPGTNVTSINPDLNLHILREPADDWLAVMGDTRLDFNSGSGVSTAQIRDSHGVCGLASNCQLVARR